MLRSSFLARLNEIGLALSQAGEHLDDIKSYLEKGNKVNFSAFHTNLLDSFARFSVLGATIATSDRNILDMFSATALLEQQTWQGMISASATADSSIAGAPKSIFCTIYRMWRNTIDGVNILVNTLSTPEGEETRGLGFLERVFVSDHLELSGVVQVLERLDKLYNTMAEVGGGEGKGPLVLLNTDTGSWTVFKIAGELARMDAIRSTMQGAWDRSFHAANLGIERDVATATNGLEFLQQLKEREKEGAISSEAAGRTRYAVEKLVEAMVKAKAMEMRTAVGKGYEDELMMIGSQLRIAPPEEEKGGRIGEGREGR